MTEHSPSMVCPRCHQTLYFESTVCLHCGASAVFDPLAVAFVDGPACVNAELIGCNWVAPGPAQLCRSCALTRTTPDRADPVAAMAWANAERQKRRMVLQLFHLGLPVISYREQPVGGLAFDLLYSSDGSVTVGHADGVITVDVGEDDDARRARLRDRLGERYRTLLGHFRHEIGHYYWPLCAGRPEVIDATRALFGDERADYAAALDAHYQHDDPGASPPWQDGYVSDYATAHPWEDWAETFAHVLHIVGVMSSIERYGLRLRGDRWGREEPAPEPPGPQAAMTEILAAWMPLSIALNALNRAMGLEDIYPFVLSEPVRQKLIYVHDCMARAPQMVPQF